MVSGSDAEVSQSVALHVLTREGERPLRPGFGTDPGLFATGIDTPSLQLQLMEHGFPDIQITGVEYVDTETPGAVRANISWERNA